FEQERGRLVERGGGQRGLAGQQRFGHPLAQHPDQLALSRREFRRSLVLHSRGGHASLPSSSPVTARRRRSFQRPLARTSGAGIRNLVTHETALMMRSRERRRAAGS